MWGWREQEILQLKVGTKRDAAGEEGKIPLWWPVSQTLGIIRLGQSLETAERGAGRVYGAKMEEYVPHSEGPRRISGRKEGCLCQPLG